MPTNNAYKRKYRKLKGKQPPNRWKIYGRAGAQLASDVMKLKGLINTEFKTLDTYATSNPTTGGTFLLLNGITRGTDYNNRDGRSIRIKSYASNMRFIANASASHTTVRVIVFVDKQPNAGLPSTGSLLDNSFGAPLTEQFRALDYRRRYTVLQDYRVTINPDYPEKSVRKYRKLDMKTIFDNTDSGTISDITTNSLYMLIVSDEAVNTPTVIVNSRLRFIDN